MAAGKMVSKNKTNYNILLNEKIKITDSMAKILAVLFLICIMNS